jgi:crossover junction endodeoxyribonuclease RuvC
MKILGIDPGLTGALSIVEFNDGAFPQLADSIDMPLLGSGRKVRVDVIAVVEWITRHAPASALIERAGSMPRQGVASTFIYARATGAVEAAVTLCRIPLTLVEPSVWKRKLHLAGKDKEAARQRALELFPQQHALFARKRDHNRAESALLIIASLEPRHASALP